MKITVALFLMAVSAFSQITLFKDINVKNFWVRNLSGATQTFSWTNANERGETRTIRTDTVFEAYYASPNPGLHTASYSYSQSITNGDRIVLTGSGLAKDINVKTFWVRNLSGASQTFYWNNANEREETRTIRTDTVFEAYYASPNPNLHTASFSFSDDINNGDRVVFTSSGFSIDINTKNYWVRNLSGATATFYWTNANDREETRAIRTDTVFEAYYASPNPNLHTSSCSYSQSINNGDRIVLGTNTAIEVSRIKEVSGFVIPNPLRKSSYIGLPEKGFIRVYNPLGQAIDNIIRGKEINYSAGQYIMLINVDGKSFTKKIVIQN